MLEINISLKKQSYPQAFLKILRGILLTELCFWSIVRLQIVSEYLVKRTYQPSKIKRARTHGFLVRMKTRGGKSVIASRRAKGRVRLGI